MVGKRCCHSRFEFPTVVLLQAQVFWDVMSCCLVNIFQHFRGWYCLHYHIFTRKTILTMELWYNHYKVEKMALPTSRRMSPGTVNICGVEEFL